MFTGMKNALSIAVSLFPEFRLPAAQAIEFCVNPGNCALLDQPGIGQW
jgi:hypothetical protein